MTTDAAVREEIAQLRARGDDAAARERLKRWRAEKAVEKDAARTVPDDDDKWLRQLELSLLQFHQETSQRRRGRAHRMPFVQCRECATLREAEVAKKREPRGEVARPS